MVKLLKIIGQIIGIAFEWLLIFLLLFIFFIRTSQVQTYLAKIATNYLTKELKTEVTIEKVSIVSLNRIAFDGLLIKDLQKDTLGYFKTVFFSLDHINNQHKFIINEADIENSVIKINQDKITRKFNYEFIVEYFDLNKESKSSKILFQINKLHLSNVDFSYDDFKYPFLKSGMDYDHLKIKHINLDISNIAINNGVIEGKIKKLSAIEKCGFQLSKFNCKAKISKKGVYTKNVFIETPNSSIYVPKLDLVMHQYEDFLTFIDSVSFKGSMLPSKVSLSDVAFFAPEIMGMEQVVHIKGNATGKTKKLKITNFDLKTGDFTKLSGDFILPDFRNIENSYFDEQIKYAYISFNDLKNISLPNYYRQQKIEINEYLKKLSFLEFSNTYLKGNASNFLVSSAKTVTLLGKIEAKKGIQFYKNTTNNSYKFKLSDNDIAGLKIDSFKIGKFLDNNDLNTINGNLIVEGEFKSLQDIEFNKISGKIQSLDYKQYAYKNIEIIDASLEKNIINSEIVINDENLSLNFNGSFDLNQNNRLQLDVEISHAFLDKLKLSDVTNSQVTSKLKIDLTGNHSNNLAGLFTIQELNYSEGDKKFNIPSLIVKIDRTTSEDLLYIKSKLGTAQFLGKVNFNTIQHDFENQISKIFPAIIPLKKSTKNDKLKSTNNFKYKIEIAEINELLAVLLPNLKIAPGTKIEGYYNSSIEDAIIKASSNSIEYNDLKFKGVIIDQQMSAQKITANYSVNNFYLNDSINVKKLTFNLDGDNQILNSKINWNPSSTNESSILWNTNVLGLDKYDITLLPSYFTLKEKKWNVVNKSSIKINGYTIDIGHFLLEREQQYLAIDGRISKNNDDKLNFKINDFKLDDFSSLFSSEINIKGLVNGWGYISNPYTNLTYIGDANIQDLYVNKHEVGNVFVQTQWERASNSIVLMGDLIFRGNETFGFDGHYYTDRTDDKLDFNLVFDNTNIEFVNAFVDPEIITDIKGSLLGNLKVNGNIENPKIKGDVSLLNGNAKFELLNVNYGLNGKIKCDESGFFINNMPITDEEGNTGLVVGSIYHQKFENWDFDIVFNLEDKGIRSGFAPNKIEPLDRFLIMNTSYKEDDVYYGKGYGTGFVEIFGTTENIEIDVNLKTEEGSKIFFPMFGTSEINEEDNFITFIDKTKSTDSIKEPKIDFTGIDLTMNFRVTPEAEIKIILDETTNDEITATGSGDISVALDKFDDLTLNGTFKVKEGNYNFVMRPINQKFIIQENGTVSWTGDPYNALLNLKCYYTVNANLNEISTLQNSGSGFGAGNQEVKCYLNLTESLLKPTISFDIQAPKANETGQSLLNRIKSDPDMLNKQFFSLLLFKKFQPIDGQTNTGGGGSSAALDLAQSQINSMLSQVSKDYKLNVGLDKNNLTSRTSMTVGISKTFYGDRLLVKGNFGVENTGLNINQNKNLPIGDVNIEYILNESGTFRINIFNESNQNRIFQLNQGLFTQGTGVQYKEDFNNVQDFQFYQYCLNLFRSKKKKKQTFNSKSKLTPIPSE